MAQLESILDELNRRVYKPMARGRAALARKAVQPECAIGKSNTVNAWAQRPGAVLWDTLSQSWNLHDIALFEASFALYGKDFEAIQRVVSSKTTHEIIHFFYLWKMTSHYREYKVKAAAKLDRAKAAAMAAKLAAAEKHAVTSKHPLGTFWGEKKNRRKGSGRLRMDMQEESQVNNGQRKKQRRSRRKRRKQNAPLEAVPSCQMESRFPNCSA